MPWVGTPALGLSILLPSPMRSLLVFTANSAAQSSAQTHIHSAIVVIDTSNNA